MSDHMAMTAINKDMALTVIVEMKDRKKGKKGKRPEEVCVLLRLNNGAPDQHGAELKDCLDGLEITGELPEELIDRSVTMPVKSTQDAGSLAAILVSYLYTKTLDTKIPDGVKLLPPNKRDPNAQYIYAILVERGQPLQLSLRKKGVKNNLYRGQLSKFDPKAKFKAEALSAPGG